MEPRNRPSADTKLVARHAISTFGAPPSVWRFTTEQEKFSIDIGGCADRPLLGVNSYTTIGLSDYDEVSAGEPAQRLELAAIGGSNWPLFPNILAAAAVLLIRRRTAVKPGDSLRGVIAEIYPRATVPHLYLARPFPWGERLSCLRGETKTIAWLLAVPVTIDELLVLETHGDAALEQLYRQRQADMYSLGRATWL